MSKQVHTYRATWNGETKTERSSRDIKWGSVGDFGNGSWFLTLTAQADPVKAARAAKSSNPYIESYHLVEVERVEEADAQ